MPCSCGMVYISQTGRSVRERMDEHIRNTNLNQTDKFSIAQHSYETGHGIMFNSIKILHKEHRKSQRLIKKKAVEISKDNNNFNRNYGLKLNHIWTSALQQDGAPSLVRSKQAPWTNEKAPRKEFP